MNSNFDVIFLGDSLTLGYGVAKENSWVFKLAKECCLSSLNKGCNGDTTVGMLSRYYTNVIIYKPSKIFIMAGTNDLLIGRSVSAVVDNIELMIMDGLSIDSEVIIGTPPKIIGSMADRLFSPSSFYSYAEKELPNLRKELINLCTKHKINYIDFYELTLNRNDIYLDGLHLTELGHELMFRKAIDYFKTC